jgi:2-hydroxychromene-2-carboxylate isomerase
MRRAEEENPMVDSKSENISPNANQSLEPQVGGAARLDRSHLQREIQRRIMRMLPTLLRLDATRREFIRRVKGERHIVDFFHQVDDPYSHLALEAIAALLERYDIEIRFHLTSQTDRKHAPEPELLSDYARRDCAWVAPHYGLEFSSDATRPTNPRVTQVEAMLANLTSDPRFLEIALRAGRALWSANMAELDQMAKRVPLASEGETKLSLTAGNALRTKLRHYSGAMFWYAGEWYWGVDRLYHLESRLIRLGASKTSGSRSSEREVRFRRPPIDAGNSQNNGRLTLEIFPSLRSPYTAMIFERSLALAKSVDVPVTLHPVMPMVMRGVPAPAAKGLYIMMDTLREARHIGAPFGNMYDPIGDAVERGFAVWPYARDKGRGAEFIASFLRAAFVLGQPTGTELGLARVVEEAGLSYSEARPFLDQSAWRDELEHNRKTMYEELGLWGVPSYRLREAGQPDLCVWGQDRLWLIAAEIRRRLAN